MIRCIVDDKGVTRVARELKLCVTRRHTVFLQVPTIVLRLGVQTGAVVVDGLVVLGDIEHHCEDFLGRVRMDTDGITRLIGLNPEVAELGNTRQVESVPKHCLDLLGKKHFLQLPPCLDGRPEQGPAAGGLHFENVEHGHLPPAVSVVVRPGRGVLCSALHFTLGALDSGLHHSSWGEVPGQFGEELRFEHVAEVHVLEGLGVVEGLVQLVDKVFKVVLYMGFWGARARWINGQV
mmetsp:Transcript_35810/g.78185  ORF Transcript_35810/g.78185 Transcript_35810/m.78185 type:complete len:235 (+) Transcript_35810:226-930(+)